MLFAFRSLRVLNVDRICPDYFTPAREAQIIKTLIEASLEKLIWGLEHLYYTYLTLLLIVSRQASSLCKPHFHWANTASKICNITRAYSHSDQVRYVAIWPTQVAPRSVCALGRQCCRLLECSQVYTQQGLCDQLLQTVGGEHSLLSYQLGPFQYQQHQEACTFGNIRNPLEENNRIEYKNINVFYMM